MAAVNKNKMMVGCSPITHKIYAGTLLKDGCTWSSNRQNVTDSAVGAVAEHLLGKQEAFVFSIGKKKYALAVTEITKKKEG